MTAAAEGRTSLLRPTVLAGAVLASIIVSFVAVVAAADGASSLAGRVGGDFPAFYGAGSIVADGDVDLLYDLERQTEAQRELLPDDPGVLYFAYPPPVAGAYSLLARLPYVAAYGVHTALMAAALVGAYWLVRPMLRPPPVPGTRGSQEPQDRVPRATEGPAPGARGSQEPQDRVPRAAGGGAPDGIVVAAVAFTFLPLFMAVTLGQNSALLVLLVAASWRLARDEHDLAAGLVLGLLLFKPQYAVPLVGLHVVRGRWRVALASAAVGVCWWLAGVAMLGTSWVGDWVAQVGDFTTLDADVNGANAVSWLGIAEHVLGVGSTPALALGGVLAAATVLALVAMWWRRPPDALALPMAAASVGILLVSPHAMFYDGSLVALAVAGLVAARRDLPMVRVVAVVWVLGALHPLKEVVGLTPVALTVIGVFALAVREAWRSLDEGPPPTPLDRLGPGRVDPARPELSVVIPAYDEAGRIEPTLERLETWLGERHVDAEVLVVDDGSNDDTTDRCLLYADRLPGLRVLRLHRNRGKGYAVRVGMLAATGEWRAFLDADGSTDPSELPKLLDPGLPVAIASVAVTGAHLDRAQSGIRASLGRFGNVVIQRLVLPGIEDSQRGCKVFRGDVADEVFGRSRIDGWGFDVEALALARAMGHEPLEVGVRWEHRPVGHVRPWHYLSTIGEVLRVRRAVGFQPVLDSASVPSPP